MSRTFLISRFWSLDAATQVRSRLPLRGVGNHLLSLISLESVLPSSRFLKFAEFSASLYDKGYRNITNIDISTVVINQMSDAYADRNEMEFTVMDARNMEFIPDQCFDLIIDKALFDAVICSENNLKDIESLLKEMHRALKLGGVYLLVSHGAPNNRINHIKRYIDVDIDVVKLRECHETPVSSFTCHYYRCTSFYADHICILLHPHSTCSPSAKPPLNGVDEQGEAKFHFLYVLTKPAN